MRLLTFRLRRGGSPADRRAGFAPGADLRRAAGVAGDAPPAFAHEGPARRRKPAMKQVPQIVRAGARRPRRFRRALLDEREIRFLPPIPDADKFLCVGQELPHAPRRAEAERPDHRDAAGAHRLRQAQLLPRRTTTRGVARPEGHREPRLRARAGVRSSASAPWQRRRRRARTTSQGSPSERPHRPRRSEARSRLGSRFWTGRTSRASGPLAEDRHDDEIPIPTNLWMVCT